MKITAPKDFWSGLLFIAIAAGVIALSTQYRFGTPQRMGPGFFPIMVAIALAGLGGAIAVRGLFAKGDPVSSFAWRPLLVSVAAVALFGVALRTLGLVAAIGALVVVGAFAGREARPVETIALAAALIVFSIAIFVKLLGLDIPLWPEF